MKDVSRILLEMPDLEPWPEAVDGPALLDGINGILGRFAVLPQWAPEALTLFDLHTYAFHLRSTVGSRCGAGRSKKGEAGPPRT